MVPERTVIQNLVGDEISYTDPRKRMFWNAQSHPKLIVDGVNYPDPRKMFWNAVPGCFILKKTFWKGILARSARKILRTHIFKWELG
jgi:hypothetical protein